MSRYWRSTSTLSSGAPNEGEERKKVKLHPPPLPPAPGAKVQREEEEGTGVGAVGAKGTSPKEVASARLRTFSYLLCLETTTRVRALTLAGPTLR